MVEDARALRQAAQARGGSDTVWLRLAADLLRSVPQEWWRAWGARSAGSVSPPSAWAADGHAAVRSLVRSPRFSVGVVTLLGVGMAACVAVASVVSAYLLRPLPYPEPDRLVLVDPSVPVSTTEVDDLFEETVSWDLDVFTLLDGEAPELVYGSWVSSGYADVFGLRTAIGRLFTAEEALPGGPAVALISHELWRTRYGGDPSVLGRTVSAFTSDRPEDAELFTIVGVLAADAWHYQRYTDLLTPLREERNVYGGRLREGVPPAEAARTLKARARPRLGARVDSIDVNVIPLQEMYTHTIRPVLDVAVATVLLALLIACGNTAALLLVRAAGRQREFTIRSALGAGTGRLTRQLLLEGLLLGGAAALLGVGLAWGALSAWGAGLQAQLGREVPGGAAALRLDLRTWLTALALAVTTGTVFGLVPLAGLRRPQVAALAEGARSSAGRSRRRSLRAIVAGGVALSLTLVVPAGLAFRSLRHVATLDVGFHGEQVYGGGVLLRSASYPTLEERSRFFERLLEGARDLPGVEAAAIGVQLPFHSGRSVRMVEGEREPGLGSGTVMQSEILTHDADWFDVLAVPVVEGRSFTVEDRAGTEPVTVVSRTLAHRLWPGSDPLGRRIRVRTMTMSSGEPGPWMRVVGVVPDVITEIGASQGVGLHVPLSQNAGTWALLTVRMRPGSGDPADDMRSLLRALDATVSLSETGWLRDELEAAARPSRFLASLLGIFAAFAIAVAVLGLYAVLSFAAVQRTRDVAIRMAVGAAQRDVARLFLGEGMALVLVGLAAGCAGAWTVSRALTDQLHGVHGFDPFVYSACVLLLATVGGIAAWVPARRMARTDPMTALREE